MKTYKKGISLIVLVITIIVLAILATTVIISLSNTNIIGEASDAVKKTNLQSYQEQAALAYAGWKADNKAATLTNLDELKDYGFDASTLTGNHKALILNGVPKVVAVDVWDGVTVDTVFEGEGTAANPYKISSAAELAALSTIMTTESGSDTYNGKYYELTTSIDLNNKPWTPIQAVYDSAFSGTFNGNNNVIFNLNVSEVSYAGLFARNSGIIENVVVSGGSVSGTSMAGAIVGYGWLGLSMINCCNAGVNVTSTKLAGGIAGYVDHCIVQNCTNNGNVTGEIAAGFAPAYVNASFNLVLEIRNCTNYGTIHGTKYASGLAVPVTGPSGTISAESTINIGSVNYGTVTVDAGGTIIE